jgi:hypothetical protein
MTVITIAAAVITAATIVLPALAELRRIHSDRNNPIRLLRIPTRRNQVLELSASGSFAGGF